MAGLFDIISKTANDAVSRASTKAEEIYEINKYKNQQVELKKDLAMAKRRIGDYCYKKYEDGEELDEVLVKLCEEVKKVKQQMKDLEEDIEKTRENIRVRQSEAGEDRV